MTKLLRAPTREYLSGVADSHRWDKFVPREGDIVIATYPKCGTTWTQRIVDLLIFQNTEPRPVVMIAPWLDATIFGPLEETLAMLNAQTHRRFIKTHLPFDSVPVFEGVKYIHVARDGRDACLSMHNHMLAMKPEFLQRGRDVAMANPKIKSSAVRPEKITQDPREWYLGWIAAAEAPVTEELGLDLPVFEFENTYWRERTRENVLFVHYNDLKADLVSEMQRIAEFLDIRIAPALMAELADAATFEGMRKTGDALMPMAPMVFEGGTQRFLNKGINGRWKAFLTREDLARYDALVKKNWTAAEAAWIAGGRRVAGDPRTIA